MPVSDMFISAYASFLSYEDGGLDYPTLLGVCWPRENPVLLDMVNVNLIILMYYVRSSIRLLVAGTSERFLFSSLVLPIRIPYDRNVKSYCVYLSRSTFGDIYTG